MLGRRLLKDINVLTDCNKNVTGALHKIYCGNSTQYTKCDPYYIENNVTLVDGIRGLASGVFLGTRYRKLLATRARLSLSSYLEQIPTRSERCEVKMLKCSFSYPIRRKHMGQVPRGGPIDLLRQRPEGYRCPVGIELQSDSGRPYHNLHHPHRHILPLSDG